jgi:hypothetical protein
MGGGINDRHRAMREIFDSIDHAENLDAATFVVNAARDGSVDDRARAWFDGEVAADRPCKISLTPLCRTAPWVMRP